MKYLCIANKGYIEEEALTLVGASSKRNEHEYIGMFGSGNKYALAYFLRNGFDVQIYSGQEKIDIDTKPVSFRDQSFDVIHINGERTSITTEMGHKWKLWQAIRELYANAVDEGSLFFDTVEEINPEEGSTHIYLEVTQEVEEFLFNLNDYIAFDKEVVFENEIGKIYKKHSDKTCIYRKGIKCYEIDRPSIFDYDFHEVDINEDRIAKYDWELIEKMWGLLSQADINIVPYETLNKLSTKVNYIENDIDRSYIWSGDIKFSDAWKKPLKNKSICPWNMAGYLNQEDRLKTYLIPSNLYTHLATLTENKAVANKFKLSGGTLYTDIEELSDDKTQMLERIYDFLIDTGINIQYKWKVVSFPEKRIKGTIDKENELILISDAIFEEGQHYVLNTIIEEYIHLKYGVGDETRGFQEAIINEYISYAKKINNVKF